MIGFETIGNATIIAYDDRAILATDPWITGNAYFGSWSLPHEIPTAQRDAILACPYIWISHGHPDHLNPDSLDLLTGKTILLPNHAGSRILQDFQHNGLNCRVLPDGEWIELSLNVKVMCLADYNQDGTLLIAIRDTVVVDFNDGRALGWRNFLRKEIAPFRNRYILALRNYGDADMLNLFDEDGTFIAPPAARKAPVGPRYARLLRDYGGTHTLPFSCFHLYQREDSVFARAYETPLEAHREGFDSRAGELLPPFVSVDVAGGRIETLQPKELTRVVRSPSEFGDNWSDPLERDEIAAATAYFRKKQRLARHIGFIRLDVGGVESEIALNPQRQKIGITFSAPRQSLVTAIRYEIFDDMLIGNFMKTTLHGMKSLYPHFTPVVAKYADNGRANSEAELAEYFDNYHKRVGFAFVMDRMEHEAENIFRSFVSPQSTLFKVARKISANWLSR